MKRIILLMLLAAGAPALAQTSASFNLEEHVLNAGGHPGDGATMSSASFRISLDAIGESVAAIGLSSESFHLDGSFLAAYPPPGEVTQLLFWDETTLVWKPEKSVGVYNLYRDAMSALSGLGYGQCEQLDLPDESATDADLPAPSEGYFYLVTAENRLKEEGTKGWDSDAGERGNPTPCP